MLNLISLCCWLARFDRKNIMSKMKNDTFLQLKSSESQKNPHGNTKTPSNWLFYVLPTKCFVIPFCHCVDHLNKDDRSIAFGQFAKMFYFVSLKKCQDILKAEVILF